jgi:hypothetical protein
MEKNNLPGLSPLWLISLAMVLGVLILTAVPLILSKEAIHPSDWIGFAGSVLVGGIALLAAIIAWRAVQSQISVQNRIAEIQSAIQRTELHQGNFAILQCEVRFCKSLSTLATGLAIPCEHILTQPNPTALTAAAAKTFYESSQAELAAIEAELDLAMVDLWAFRDGLRERSAMVSAIFKVQIVIIDALLPLKQILVVHPGEGNCDPLSESEILSYQKIDTAPPAQVLKEAAAVYQAIVFTEIGRLHRMMATTRAEAGL